MSFPRKSKGNTIKICRTATVAYYMVSQLKRQVEHLRDSGMEVMLISSDGPELSELELGNGLEHTIIEIPRSLAPWKDLKAFFKLLIFFLRHRFDIVHSTTPKAGLLTAVAALLAGIPVRLHTFTGQQWVTLSGAMRTLSRLADKLIGILNTRCYADSRSQADFLIDEGIISSHKIDVIGHGSLAGVDLKRFDTMHLSENEKNSLRLKLSLPIDAMVFVFIGRITRDKGVRELLSAFTGLNSQGYNADLLLIGPRDEECGGIGSISREEIEKCPRTHYTGYAKKPEQYLAISDIMCLPSYREGFGTVVIEAAAMGIPTIGTRINGLIDAIDDRESGLLVPPRDSEALQKAMKELLDNHDLFIRLQQSAKKRCRQLFDANSVNNMVYQEYIRLLENR